VGPGRGAPPRSTTPPKPPPGHTPALAAAEASTTTIQTVISGSAADAGARLDRDDAAAALVAAFEGVPLDDQARADILAALEAAALRRRTLPDETNPDLAWVDARGPDAALYAGELESGTEDCPPAFTPGEFPWESLGEPVPAWFTEWEDRQAEGVAALPAEPETSERRAQQSGSLSVPTSALFRLPSSPRSS
jgi:hypothetical protein